MKLVAKKQDLESWVRKADAFTDKTIGSSPHLQCILIESEPDNGLVRFTAESAYSAITFDVTESVDILEEGRILVMSGMLRETLATIPEGHTVTLSLIGDALQVVSDSLETVIQLIPLGSGKVLLPKVGAADLDRSLSMTAENFNRGFITGSASHDKSGRYPFLNSVHIGIVESGEGPLLRFTSFDKSSTTYCSMPIISSKSDDLKLLVDPSSVFSALEFVRQGHSVEVAPGSEGKMVHLMVKDSAGIQLYHIRAATLSHDIDTFPADKLVTSIRGKLGPAKMASLDKAEMLRLFGAASKLAVFNKVGQSKEITVTLDRNDGFQVEIDGPAIEFQDSVPVQTWDGATLEFVFKWGLYGSIIDAYPLSETIKMVFLEKPSGEPFALALFKGDWTPDSGDVPLDYFSLLPIVNASWKS